MTKTINDVYMELFKRLKEADDPQPSLSAREITAYACKADKNKTADWGHVYLDDATVDYAHLLCDRCLDGEPLAYILGEWDFYGLTFQIDRSVLIPRSDTERLCELVIGQARQRVSPRILDLCCGSGCIGIAAAHEVEDARVAGVDISEGALRVTRENARRLGVQSRYVALKADVRFRPPNNMGQFDILVSNPPYVTRAEMRALEPERRGLRAARSAVRRGGRAGFLPFDLRQVGGAARAGWRHPVRVRLPAGDAGRRHPGG